jgi:hypothetical protein
VAQAKLCGLQALRLNESQSCALRQPAYLVKVPGAAVSSVIGKQ